MEPRSVRRKQMLYEKITLGVIAFVAVLYILLDIAGSSLADILKVDKESIVIAIMGILSTYLLAVSFTEEKIASTINDVQNDIEAAQKTIIDSLNGVRIERFSDINEVDFYIAEKIRSAKLSVLDLTWQDSALAQISKRDPVKRNLAFKAMEEAIQEFCSKPGNSSIEKEYREIFTFLHKKRLEKMENHIQLGDVYRCSYFENDSEELRFPKMSFVIIDREEIIFASSAYGYKNSLCSVIDRSLVEIFIDYYEQAWNKSIPIKDEKSINVNLKNEIVKKYSAYAN